MENKSTLRAEISHIAILSTWEISARRVKQKPLESKTKKKDYNRVCNPWLQHSIPGTTPTEQLDS